MDIRNTVNFEGRRVVAVDPSVIELGTALLITLDDGSTIKATAQDIGGAIKGNSIDIAFANKTDAVKFGRKKVMVEIDE